MPTLATPPASVSESTVAESTAKQPLERIRFVRAARRHKRLMALGKMIFALQRIEDLRDSAKEMVRLSARGVGNHTLPASNLSIADVFGMKDDEWLDRCLTEQEDSDAAALEDEVD